jgi:signal transduction histidine kinase
MSRFRAEYQAQALDPPEAMLLRRASTLFVTPDVDDPVRVERAVGRLRVALAISGLVAITVDPSQPALYAPVAYSLLVFYVIASLFLWASAPRTARAARRTAWVSHVIDVVAAGSLTLFTDGPNSPFFLFLTFPLLTAAYRWGLVETLLSAFSSLLVLGLDVVLVQSALPLSIGILSGEFRLNRLIIRATYLVIAGLAMGYLADKEKQRRHESIAVAELIREARLDAGLGGTLHSLLSAIGRMFESDRALLVVQESASPRTYLLDVATSWRHRGAMTSSELDDAGKAAYLFEAPGHSWSAVDLPNEGLSLTVLDDAGESMEGTALDLPGAFRSRHRFRSVLAVTVHIDREWTGRLLLLNPQIGDDREESVRFAQRLVRDLGPAVRQVSVFHRLRRRAERVERLRLARELHDGPIQTLSAAVLQLEVMQHRAQANSSMASDLGAVQALLRDEINSVRDLTQEMRLGLLETDSAHLIRDLDEIVERFGRQHDIQAQFVSEVDFVHVPTVTRHELLRVVLEALVNVRKHSGATETLVWVRMFGESLILSVEDNGRGFGFDGRLTHRELDARHEGPVVIRERVGALGGELAVESRPGHGARLEVRLRLRGAQVQALRAS